MRHRRKGRRLGRSSSHRRALFRNMLSCLFLTEVEDADLNDNTPKVSGRITTTITKAKEIRPLVEKCVTIAKKGLIAKQDAEQYATDAEKGSTEFEKWRSSDQYAKWVDARSGYVNAQRRVIQMVGSKNKEAMRTLFDVIAPRFMDRPGGYTRIVRLAKPRLGDNGTRAILEFVGRNDRVKAKSEKPTFADDDAPIEDSPVEENATEEAA
ncbi:MAG: L17 family ribosomal protein, partial [Planctomycetota bacterium]